MRMPHTALSHFTPSLMASSTLEAIFVKRQRELERILEQLRSGVLEGSHHHILLLGPRGIGKTHMMSMIFHRLNAMEDLKEQCCIAWLVEEEWSVASWLDLLLVILRALIRRETPATGTLPAFEKKLEQLYDLEAFLAQRRAEHLLLEFLQGRRLVLLMENLDMIFEGLEEEGQQRWRSFLQEQANTSIVASSQSLFTAVSSRTRPFYGFFRQQILEKFSLDDACDMLERIARLRNDIELAEFVASPHGRARVRAVAHFAGGNPRVYIILSQFLTRESLDELVQPFMRMLDDLTPYYQSRMQGLSPQQRKLVELLCLERIPMPVKQIAKRAFITPQTAASQLRKLLEQGFLVSRESGRESFYELREPLMRLTFEVKMNRGETIPLFLDFLRLWYPPENLDPSAVDPSATETSVKDTFLASMRQHTTTLNPLTPRQWRDLWREHLDVLPELAPFLHILDVSEEYLEHRDKRVLLSLPLEERILVAEHLKLTPEESATD